MTDAPLEYASFLADKIQVPAECVVIQVCEEGMAA